MKWWEFLMTSILCLVPGLYLITMEEIGGYFFLGVFAYVLATWAGRKGMEE